METIGTALKIIGSILAVLLAFNLIIFVHELGHFLAAKWRGLTIDRFQIWFGKPLWKKTIGGVQYGLGWIPAGGFVALPQMAPMEAIEGSNAERDPLPPIKPLDKIIVAFAGPLFSFLLALAIATIVWKVGKPADVVRTNTIGFVEAGSSAATAGLLPGDKIISINGATVDGFAGSLDSIMENIMLSEGNQIVFVVERPGVGQVSVTSGFTTGESLWFQRRALRDVGITWAQPAVVAAVYPGGPGEFAGLKPGDRIVALNGTPLQSPFQLKELMKAAGFAAGELTIERAGQQLTLTVKPESPIEPAGREPMLGIAWDDQQGVDKSIIHPGPWRQVTDSLRMMVVTFQKLVARNSSVGVDQLSGPVGIFKTKYKLLQTDGGWRRVLWFMVLFNVNLAILNMLPLPVLDGGHITLAIMEKIARKPVRARFLEAIQLACVVLLIGMMLFVTSKDIGDDLGRGSGGSGEVRFAPRSAGE
jgi:regulator of sigma E protease